VGLLAERQRGFLSTMNYTRFRQQLDGLLRQRRTDYPSAAGYLQESCLVDVSATLRSTLAGLEHAVSRDDAHWARFDGVIADISRVLGVAPGRIPNLMAGAPLIPRRDFKSIKEKLYDTPQYPVSEHLYYIDFPPALEREAYVSEQVRKLELANARFCDLGCGPGVLLSLVLQTKPLWVGCAVDVSLECARYASRLAAVKGVAPRARVHVADARRLPYCDACFDVVMALEILEHIPDPEAGLEEAVRVLRPGGVALLGVPVGLDVGMHLHVFRSPEEVLAAYQAAGLKVLGFRRKQFTIATGPFTDTFALARKPD
jgi:SAM-dependent methyltransferase